MEISLENHKNWTVVVLKGQFVVNTLLALRSKLEKLERTKNTDVCLDISEVDRVDSSAIGMILNFSRRLISKGGKLVLAGPQQEVKEIFEMVSLDDHLMIFPSRAAFEDEEGAG